MAEGELFHIAVQLQVLVARVVLDTDDAALEQRTEALNAVRVSPVLDILAD